MGSFCGEGGELSSAREGRVDSQLNSNERLNAIFPILPVTKGEAESPSIRPFFVAWKTEVFPRFCSDSDFREK